MSVCAYMCERVRERVIEREGVCVCLRVCVRKSGKVEKLTLFSRTPFCHKSQLEKFPLLLLISSLESSSKTKKNCGNFFDDKMKSEKKS